MADDSSITGSISTLVRGDDEPTHEHSTEELHGDDAPKPSGKRFKAGKKEEDGDIEYEVEFETPFGKIEFEFEPTSKRKKKEQERKAFVEQERAKARERDEQKKREKAEQKRLKAMKGGGGFSKLLIILLVLALIGGAVALAIWLFARKPEELEAETIPDELRAVPEPEPHGFVEKTKARLRQAVRAGRQASIEAQREQQRRYEELAGR